MSAPASEFSGLRFGNALLLRIAEAVRAGTLDPVCVGALVLNVPQPPPSEVRALWSARGAEVRRQNVAAWRAVAEVAPETLLPPNPETGYRRTLLEVALRVEFENAAFERDLLGALDAAARFNRQFPHSPLNRLIQARAERLASEY